MVLPAALVRQLDIDAAVDRMAVVRPVQEALVGDVVALAHVEVEVDRVLRDDGGQHRRGAAAPLTAGDEVAGGDEVAADAAGQRRGDMGPAHVELGLAHRGLGLVQRRLCCEALLGALVERFARSEAGGDEAAGAVELLSGKLQRRLGGGDLRPGVSQGDVVGPRVDDEEQVALLHELAVGEVDLGEVAADLRPDLDAVRRRELAGEAGPGREPLPERRGDHDHRRRHGGRGRLRHRRRHHAVRHRCDRDRDDREESGAGHAHPAAARGTSDRRADWSCRFRVLDLSRHVRPSRSTLPIGMISGDGRQDQAEISCVATRSAAADGHAPSANSAVLRSDAPEAPEAAW